MFDMIMKFVLFGYGQSGNLYLELGRSLEYYKNSLVTADSWKYKTQANTVLIWQVSWCEVILGLKMLPILVFNIGCCICT